MRSFIQTCFRSIAKNLSRDPLHRQSNGKFNINRNFTTSQINFSSKPSSITVTFVKGGNERITVTGKENDTLLDLVNDNQDALEMDGFGACEGTIACSTCHVILKKEDFDRIPNRSTEEELDMLDLAYDLTDNSRLGCQITITKDLNNLEVAVPKTIHDARQEG